MKLTSVVVLGMQLTAVRSEDALGHIDWRRDMHHLPKYWFSYVEQKIMLSLKNYCSHSFQIISCLLKVKIDSGNFEKFAQHVIHFPLSTKCVEAEKQEIMSPVTLIVLNKFNFLALLCPTKNADLKYNFAFDIDKELAFNISFKNINLLDLNGHCYANYIKLHAVRQFIFFYCGAHSDFDMYFSSHHLEFVANIKDAQISSFTSTISVISHSLVSNELLHSSSSNVHLQPQFIHKFTMKNITLFSYKVTTHKHQVVILYTLIGNRDNGHVTCFDGPGFLCRKSVFGGNHHVRKFSSFQCLIQVTQNRAQEQKEFINYTGQAVLSAELNVDRHKVIDLVYTNSSCNKNNSICVFSLLSSAESIIYITVSNFTFTGQIERSCLFGGGSIYESYFPDSSKEIFLLCNRFIDETSSGWLTYRSILTNTSRAFLVLYTYEKYSSLSVGVKVTSSDCKLIRIIQCGLCCSLHQTYVEESIVLDPFRCSVVQISSGHFYGHRSLDELVPLRVMIPYYQECFMMKKQYNLQAGNFDQRRFGFAMRMCGHLIFPHCIPVKLTIDQSSFEDQSALYRIDVFLDKHASFRILTEQSHDVICETRRIKWYHFEELYFLFYIKTSATSYQVWTDFLQNSWFNFLVEPSKFNSSERFIFLLTKLSFSQTPNVLQAFVSHAYTLDKVLILSLQDSKKDERPVCLDLYSDTGFLDIHMPLFENFRKFKAAHRQIYQYFPALEIRSCSYQLHQDHSIFFAVPGNVKQFNLSTKSTEHSALQTQLFSSWLDGFQKVYSDAVASRNISGVDLHMSKGKYHFLRFDFGISRKFSWQQADNLCSQVKGHLPRFFSREEMDDFIFLVKTDPNVLLVSLGMYVDLTYQVSGMK